MESLRKLGLLDAEGKPVEDRLSKVLNALLPRFRRRFPAIQDDVEVTEVFEEAARRITKRLGPDRRSCRSCAPGMAQSKRSSEASCCVSSKPT